MPAEPFTDLRMIRDTLGKSQSEFADLLGVSTRAVQSYEQGWRPVPLYIQKLAATLLFLSWRKEGGRPSPCWKVRRCPPEKRETCPAFQFDAGDVCWLLHGTPCKEPGRGEETGRPTNCFSCPVVGQWLPA